MRLSEKLQYVSYQDLARLQYGRILWKNPTLKERLVRHWSDSRHPYHERFTQIYSGWVNDVLSSSPEQDELLDQQLEKAGQSLRSIIREIPPVFGSFY